MKITYVEKNFRRSSLAMIAQAEEIIEEYMAQGYSLTLRQLYYQFVARDLLANKQSEYKRLGSIINDARLAGYIDWLSMEDRTRNLRGLNTWETPAEIIEGAASSFRLDKWAGQEFRPEVWIEKDALVGVIEGVCNELGVDYFSCRGYTSQSELWRAAMRASRYERDGQTPLIVHLGDHDPSGLDMTRDIFDRFRMFMGGVEVKRIALNMNQVEEFSPPPNPAKLTDARAAGYVDEHGYDSWELDALDPKYLSGLIKDTVTAHRDDEAYEEVMERESEMKTQLKAISDDWENVVETMGL